MRFTVIKITGIKIYLLLTSIFVSCHVDSAVPVEPSQGFRVLSWNLLAPMYCPPQKYPWCTSQNLDWCSRQELIVEKLKCFDADVVCLQEIQVDLWDEFVSEIPEYDGTLQHTGSHPVANAVLVKKDSFRVVRHESRSRALIVVLENIGVKRKQHAFKSDRFLYLANVHLQGGMDEDRTRVNQLKSLLKRLEKHTGCENLGGTAPCVILTGDFNMKRDNPIHKWLCGEKSELFDSRFKIPMKVPFIPFIDVYSKFPPASGSLEMTFCGGHVLDYVWISGPFHVSKSLMSHMLAAQREPQPWPSSDNPSDHAPIGVDFESFG